MLKTINSLSYIDPTFCNKTSYTLKYGNNLNTFKHNLKKYSERNLKTRINLFKIVFSF